MFPRCLLPEDGSSPDLVQYDFEFVKEAFTSDQVGRVAIGETDRQLQLFGKIRNHHTYRMDPGFERTLGFGRYSCQSYPCSALPGESDPFC